jgi:hypothetical protein
MVAIRFEIILCCGKNNKKVFFVTLKSRKSGKKSGMRGKRRERERAERERARKKENVSSKFDEIIVMLCGAQE